MTKRNGITLSFLIFNWLIIELAVCHSSYRNLIPNGNNVPDPCSPHQKWNGVGHYNKQGGGARNPFGLDFFAAGKQWTTTLCQKDSDGDGKTNGDELGDPECKWQVGQIPPRNNSLSHPGFCEPYNSPKCMELNSKSSGALQCDKQNFKCPSLNTTGVWSKDYRFMKSRVPAKKTTYICLAFETGYEANISAIHNIALEPIIDNSNMLHHILLYGCDGSRKPSRPTAYTEPYECTMGSTDCYKIIAGWSLGSPGNCLSEKMGILMNGATGYNRFIIQLHWNNPSAADNQYDSSGVKLYFEQKRRPFDGGVFILGQQYLELPPGKESIVQESVCTKPCTQTIMTKNLPMERSIFFTRGFLHMHKYGIRGSVQLFRNGNTTEYLIPNNTYRYDTPEQIVYPTSIEYKSGDELKLQCLYNTKASNDTVYYGEATTDEMCYAFMEYYPANSSYDACISYGVFSCEINGLGIYNEPTNYGRANFSGYDYGWVIKDLGHGTNCSVFKFLTNFHTKWQTLLESSCTTEALDTCRSDCRAIYDVMVKEEPCFNGWPFIFIIHFPFQYTAAPFNGPLFNYIINRIQLYVAPCRTEDRLKINKRVDPQPTCPPPITVDPIKKSMTPEEIVSSPIYFGTVIGLGVLIILLLLVNVSSFIKKNCRQEKKSNQKYQVSEMNPKA